MIANLQPYREYKDSSLPWVGNMPSHWQLIPNRAFIRKRKVLVGRRHVDYSLLSLTKQGIIVRDLSMMKGKFSSDMGTSQEVRRGDIVFCLFDVPETPRTVGLSRHDGMITGAYSVFEFLGRGNPEYFELFYRAMDDRKLLSPLYSGLRNTIPAPRFLGTKSPLPPPDEQAAIVRFLDWANGRLERAIRAKRKVISLLREQKQAIIHRAVTRGLDPNVARKPSGISWLGDLPEHWEVRRAKYVFNEVDERSKTGEEELLSVSHLTGVTPRSEKNITMFKAASYVGYKLCRPDDLVINTMWAWMAALGSSDRLGIISSAYGVYRPLRQRVIFGRYIEALLHTPHYKAEILFRSTGVRASRLRLYPEQFLNMPLTLPPYDEQVAILQRTDGETKHLSTAIARAEQEIELLREYRTRLTSDVVTGKLDVRHVARGLPVESIDNEMEPETEDFAVADSEDVEL